ncbi:MAG: hypothetical protein AAF467_24485 [Actinomycetota bacterium]
MTPSDAAHLARRFFGALNPRPPRPADEQWACDRLNDGEQALWRQMSNPDRRHAIEVARAVEAELGTATDPAVGTAALMHDVGKVRSDLGTFARVGATVFWEVVDHRRADGWLEHANPVLRRLAEYHRHPRIGGDLLAAAGSNPLTVAWATEHHQPVERWTVPKDIGRVLKACDDD